MASKIAECVVNISGQMDDLKKAFDKTKAESAKQTTDITQQIAKLFKTGVQNTWNALTVGARTMWGGVSLASKASAGVAGVAWGGIKAGLNAARGAATALAGQFKYVAAALLAMGATADTSGVRLNAVLRSTGQSAGYTREQLDQMAGGLAKAADTSGRMAREAQATLLSFGAVRGDIFQGAMKSLPDVAAFFGESLPDAAKRFGSALQDPIKGLGELEAMGIQIPRHVKDSMEAAASGSMPAWKRLQEFILSSVSKAASGTGDELSNTLAGAFGRFKARSVDFADAVAPAVKVVFDLLSSVITRLADMGKGLSGMFGNVDGGQVIATFQSVVAAVKDFGVTVYETALPAITKFYEFAKGVFDSVSAFVTENAGTFKYWGTLIAEIVGGAVSVALTNYRVMMTALGTITSTILGAMGITWEGVRDTITAVLEWLAMVFNNWEQALKVGWVAIQYGAQVAWDTIKEAFWTLVAAATGAGAAMVAALGGAFDNVKVAAQAAIDVILGSFKSLGAAIAAVFEGNNPVTAYREMVEKEMAKIRENAAKMKSLGSEAANAFKSGYGKMMEGRTGESDNAKRLRDKLGEENDKLNSDRAAQTANRGKNNTAGTGSGPNGTKATVNMATTPDSVPNMVVVKFESVGLTDMWKQMQQKMTGGSMLALQQQTAKAATTTAAHAATQTATLQSIDKKLDKGATATYG